MQESESEDESKSGVDRESESDYESESGVDRESESDLESESGVDRESESVNDESESGVDRESDESDNVEETELKQLLRRLRKINLQALWKTKCSHGVSFTDMSKMFVERFLLGQRCSMYDMRMRKYHL